MLSRFGAASRLAAAHGRRGMSTEIPIGAVARIARMHVADEATAVKADAITNEMKAELEKAALPGYVKIVRTVCKAEWAYEAAVVFDSLDNFKGYMGSEVREQNLLPKFAELSKLATKPDAVYSGNRVYDEL